jgi:hypothetical protein
MRKPQANYIWAKIVILFSIFITCGCNHKRQKKVVVPRQISQVKNLTVYSPNGQPPDTVKLIKETIFESNKHVFIDGYISGMAVDKQNRVYIAAGKPGSVGIYVFEPDGRYITTIGRYGRGPGEYETIGSLAIGNGRLYVLDPRLQKIGFFSLKDYTHIKDEILKRDKLEKPDSLVSRLRAHTLFVRNSGNILLSLSMLGINKKTDIPKILYYRLSSDGTMLPGPVLEQERFHFYFPPKNSEMKLPFTMPFTRTSLVAVTKRGSFFTAWTENFFIKKYDKDGNYMRAFYYPIKKANLSIDGLKIAKVRRKILSNYKTPKTWPALYAMKLDDKGRLWIATITNSKNTLKWWVLNQKGKLIARFTFSGKRASREVMTKPIIAIKDGYFYMHQFNFHAGIDRIVKYKIQIQ